MDEKLKEYRQLLKDTYEVHNRQSDNYIKSLAWQVIRDLIGSITKRRNRIKKLLTNKS